MADWSRFHRDPSSSVDRLHERFLAMLRDGRRAFDAAADVLLSGGDAEVVREEVLGLDRRINEAERELRRGIVVHGAVHGSAALPAALVLMSLAKDAERIGDYAKNVLMLARRGVAFPDAARREVLTARKGAVSGLLGRVVTIFERQDEAAATAFLQDVDELLRECEQEIEALVAAPADATVNRTGEVLLLRFLKRIADHAGNVATSVVMPVDQLDFRPGVPDSEQ